MQCRIGRVLCASGPRVVGHTETRIRVESARCQCIPVPRQRELQDALLGRCSEKSGSYNAMFILAGYIQQTVPVRVTSAKEHWYSSEVVEISPNPVTVTLKSENASPQSRGR